MRLLGMGMMLAFRTTAAGDVILHANRIDASSRPDRARRVIAG